MPPATENTILPGLGLGDLRSDLIARARAAGPDAGLSDAEYLLRAGVARRDPGTGETGLLLPALLLFGRDEALRAALPGHGTRVRFRDARGRVVSEDIRTNLLDTFDRLMAFAARHLPRGPESPEHPEGLRDPVLAEIFLNSLVHRDYAKPFPATFGIEPGRVFLENPGADTSSGPANPTLARAFARMGRARPAGEPSPLARWGRAYFGLAPLVFAGGVYRLVAPYPHHGPAEMRPALAPPPRPAVAPAGDPPRATHAAVPRSRPSLRELEALLAEALPAFPPALGAAGHDEGTMAPGHRPALPVRATPAPAEPASPPAAAQAAPAPSRVAPTSEDRTERILAFCGTPRYRSEIQEFAGFQNRDYFRKEILKPLIERGLLAPTLPDKPNSPNQQYRAVGSRTRPSPSPVDAGAASG